MKKTVAEICNIIRPELGVQIVTQYLHDSLFISWNCRSQTGGSGQQCCYDRSGSLITGPPGGGTVDLVSPDISFVRHFIHDVIPFLLCCKAGTFSDCSEYYQHRPSDTSALFAPPIPG